MICCVSIRNVRNKDIHKLKFQEDGSMANEKKKMVLSIDGNLYDRYRNCILGNKLGKDLEQVMDQVVEAEESQIEEKNEDTSILHWMKEIEPMRKELSLTREATVKIDLYSELPRITEPVKYIRELEMVARDVLEQLQLLIFLYKESNYYNDFFADTDNCEECSSFLETRFNLIISSLSLKCIFIYLPPSFWNCNSRSFPLHL